MKIYLTLLFSTVTLLMLCEASDNLKQSNSPSNDSIQLTSLVREVYKWHMTKNLDDFPYKYKDSSKNIFTGIDWDKYNNNIETFKKLGSSLINFSSTIRL